MEMEDVDGCAVERAGGCPYMACWSCVDRAELRPHAAAACLPSFLPCTFELCQLLLRPEFDVAFHFVASDAAPFIHIDVNTLSCP